MAEGQKELKKWRIWTFFDKLEYTTVGECLVWWVSHRLTYRAWNTEMYYFLCFLLSVRVSDLSNLIYWFLSAGNQSISSKWLVAGWWCSQGNDWSVLYWILINGRLVSDWFVFISNYWSIMDDQSTFWLKMMAEWLSVSLLECPQDNLSATLLLDPDFTGWASVWLLRLM